MPTLPDKMSLLTQDELLSVLRSLLKTTANDLLERNRLYEVERVAALFSNIQAATWVKACENHFALSPKELQKVNPEALYLQKYLNTRFQI